MQNTQTAKFFHDRIILLILSINCFMALLGSLLIVTHLGGAGNKYLIEYRSNLGNIDAFAVGGKSTFIGFIIFLVLVAGFHGFVSLKLFEVNRFYSIATLGFGTILIGYGSLASSALLFGAKGLAYFFGAILLFLAVCLFFSKSYE